MPLLANVRPQAKGAYDCAGHYRSSFMFADLRVPVERTSVEVLASDGSHHSLVVFHAPGVELESFVESPEPFFPAHAGEAFRMFARSYVVVLSAHLATTYAAADDELPETRRMVHVHLRGHGVLTGEIRYVASEGASRPIDYLNESSRSFALFTEGRVHHVVKRHVSFVEEVG